MAVLNKIRQKSFVLIIVIAMALFAFVLSGLFDGSANSANKGQDVIATINGKDIDRIEFTQRVANAQQVYRNQSSTQAMNIVWNQELRRTIMEAEFEHLGLAVERDQMRSLLATNLASFPEFQNEVGLFDENKLNEFIANLKDIAPETSFLGGRPINYQTWVANYETGIAQSGIQNNYYNMVKAGLSSTLFEGELNHKLTNDKVDVEYVQLPYRAIPDSTISVTKSDVKKYIEANATKYQVDSSRDIELVVFKETATAKDEAAIKSKLANKIAAFKSAKNNTEFLAANNSATAYSDTYLYKNELGQASDSLMLKNTGDVYGPYKEGQTYKVAKIVATQQQPDSVKVRHILVPFVGATRVADSITTTDAQAKAKADSILKVLKASPSKFKSLLALSSDKVSNKKDGEIEMAYNAGFAPEFKAFGFENKKGAIDVVKTSFGYHIIEVLEQKNFQKTLKVAYLSSKIEPSEETIDDVFKATSKFEIAIASQDFSEAAKAKNYTVKPVNGIKELDENIPGLGQQRSIVRWAFEEDTQIGDTKRFTIPEGGFAIARLKVITNKGLMSVEKASVTATREIKKQKKAKLIIDRVKYGAINEIATAEKQTVRNASGLTMTSATLTGAGAEPKVIGAAFGLNEGETSQLIEGNQGVYVVKVIKKINAEPLQNYQTISTRLGNERVTKSQTEIYNALKKDAVIEDNRASVY